MTQNVQNLPAGLAGRVAAASQGAPAHQAPAPAPVAAPEPVPAPAAPVAPAVEQGTNPAPAPAPAPAAVNPMLSHVSQNPASEPAPAQPAQPEPVKVPEVPQPEQPAAAVTSITELAGQFAQDSQLAPVVSYLDAVFKDNGLDIQRALGQAADELDERFIDKAYLREKLGDKAETIIKTAEDSIKYVAAHAQESLKQVYATAGGEEAFRQAAAVYNTKADPTEKALIAEMLDSGDRNKMLYAAKKITELAVQAGGIVRHVNLPQGVPGATQGLSREQYLAEISKRNVSPERYDELRALRALGKQQGL